MHSIICVEFDYNCKFYRKKDKYSPFQEPDPFANDVALAIMNQKATTRMHTEQREENNYTLSSDVNHVTFANQHATTAMEEEIQAEE